ncbi:MAG: PHP domain-containing protein [Methanocellales archaeon]|nr:PHP domain-containing protein [Methanocellales archaeon]MDI6902464.1 PHP domain-containing protein [Methanocellales archaeon]
MVLKFDLHVHSGYSHDGHDSIDTILQRAKEIGLDGIAITDHDTIQGGLIGIQRAKELDLDLMVIPGVEISTTKGHLIVLGITDEIPPGMSLERTIEMARDLGGTVIVPHPFHPFRHGLGYIPEDIDAVEIYNSRFIIGYSNEKARKLAVEGNIPTVAGSDAHIAEMIGYAITEINAAPSVDKILQAIRAGDAQVKGEMTPLRLFAKQTLKAVFRYTRRFLSEHL